MELIDRMLAGDQRALARLITLVENRRPEMTAIMEKVYDLAGRARTCGHQAEHVQLRARRQHARALKAVRQGQHSLRRPR